MINMTSFVIEISIFCQSPEWNVIVGRFDQFNNKELKLS